MKTLRCRVTNLFLGHGDLQPRVEFVRADFETINGLHFRVSVRVWAFISRKSTLSKIYINVSKRT